MTQQNCGLDEGLQGVTSRKARVEQIWSAFPQIADIECACGHFADGHEPTSIQRRTVFPGLERTLMSVALPHSRQTLRRFIFDCGGADEGEPGFHSSPGFSRM